MIETIRDGLVEEKLEFSDTAPGIMLRVQDIIAAQHSDQREAVRTALARDLQRTTDFRMDDRIERFTTVLDFIRQNGVVPADRFTDAVNIAIALMNAEETMLITMETAALRNSGGDE